MNDTRNEEVNPEKSGHYLIWVKERTLSMYCQTRLSPHPFVCKTSFIMLLLIAAIMAAITSLAAAQNCNGIPDIECQALYALYNSTDGDNWTDNTNWLSDAPVDDWYGVISPAGTGLGVWILALRHNNLTGIIPPELGNLSDLASLDLGYNSLIGSIPPELGSLASLESLFLFHNNLTGLIPPELGNLSSLKNLNLRWNNITGEIPRELGNLTNLSQLDLNTNSLNGSIPPELGNLIELKDVFFMFNNLTGSIPSELGNLVNLRYFWLNANSLSGDLPTFLATTPAYIDLRYNSLYASDPDVLTAVEEKHYGEFLSTQTLPPENVTAETLVTGDSEENSVLVSWNSIAYDEDDGGYLVYYKESEAAASEAFEVKTEQEVFSGADVSSAYHYYGITADKKTTSMVVSNLKAGTEYEFRVDTITWANEHNQNDLQPPQPPEAENPTAVTGTYSRAFLPNWKQAPGYWTGVVALNFGDSAFNLNLSAYDSNGVLETLGQNPATTPIGPGLQKSLLGSEFFGSSGQEDLSWIELGADGTNKMGSIFLFGVSDTQLMDGAEAQSAYAQKLYFTRPLDEGFFDGWGPEFQISLVNPTDEAATVRCILRGSNGEAEQAHVIPSKGFIAGDTEDLIGVNHGIVNGYMEVEVTEGNGVIGFSRIEFPGGRTALGMNAVQTTASKRFYSAQLAHGMNIVTNLRLVNTSSSTRNVTLTAVADNGSPLTDPVTVQIPSKQIYGADLGTLFELEGEGVITTGSLVADADGNGIIGDIIFADGDTLEYAMSLPLQDRLFEEAVFNHISNLPTVFTGFAFYNPGDGTANVLIEAIGTDGQKVVEKTLILNPGERIARTLTDVDMWPFFPTQSGGYIKIQSDQPIAGQQLFGDRSLRYMAAIPPTTRFETMFD